MKPFARINLSSAALRRGEGNVANVKMLPRPISIVNERNRKMKKMMMAAAFAAMIAATAGWQLCDEPKPEVYSRSFVGMDKATVMFEWT